MSDICLEASDNLMQQPTQIRQADGTKQNKSIGNDSKHASMENKLDDTQKRNFLFARFIYSALICQVNESVNIILGGRNFLVQMFLYNLAHKRRSKMEAKLNEKLEKDQKEEQKQNISSSLSVEEKNQKSSAQSSAQRTQNEANTQQQKSASLSVQKGSIVRKQKKIKTRRGRKSAIKRSNCIHNLLCLL